MSLSTWIAIGGALAVAVPLPVGLAVGALLATLDHERSDLTEAEAWTSLSPARAEFFARRISHAVR